MDGLIVASTIQQQHALSDVLNGAKIDCIVCSTAAEARRVMLCRPFDIFVVNGGLPDERGNELAATLSESDDCGGVYIDDYTRVDMFGDDLAACGVVSLVRPITKTALSEAVRLISVANTRVRALKAKNEELAAKIAGEGKGIYVNAANNDALNELSKQLDTVKKTALETSFSALHDELFPIFLWIAFGLLIINVFILERKNSWLARITFFKKEETK